MFDEFVKELISELKAREGKKRARSGDAQDKFEYSLRYILDKVSVLPSKCILYHPWIW